MTAIKTAFVTWDSDRRGAPTKYLCAITVAYGGMRLVGGLTRSQIVWDTMQADQFGILGTLCFGQFLVSSWSFIGHCVTFWFLC